MPGLPFLCGVIICTLGELTPRAADDGVQTVGSASSSAAVIFTAPHALAPTPTATSGLPFRNSLATLVEVFSEAPRSRMSVALWSSFTTASINLRVYDAANTSSKLNLKIPPHARTRPYEPPYEPNTRRVY